MATIKNIHDYTDIMEITYQKSTKYKHMTPRERAAQFAPIPSSRFWVSTNSIRSTKFCCASRKTKTFSSAR